MRGRAWTSRVEAVVRPLRRRRKSDPAASKHAAELEYWRSKRAAEGSLTNSHYEEFFTTYLGLDRGYYRGKRILDIGCGPRGSLEWAGDAEERIGLDPLADEYRELGIDRHQMTYVAAPAEAIPFPSDHFDVVSSFNSLDHVEVPNDAAREIIRVLKPGGMFLLLSDVNHAPTATEPNSYSWDVVDLFRPKLEVVDERHYERSERGIYQSVRDGVDYDHDDPRQRYAVIAAKFTKL